MTQEILHNTRTHMDKSIESLKRDFSTLRSGKVSVNILDNIRISYYDSPTPLNQVGSVIAQDATTIVITPWEKSLLKDIERAIAEANIGVNPNSDSECVKLFFPPMTQDQRKEIAKETKAMGEKAKVAIRNIRQDSNNHIKKLEKDREITEDISKKAQDDIQKLTDEFVKKIDEMVKNKEDEVMKV
ncbi:ribosome recycling factor [Helicobacter fennelliae]|uniref:Ribosome-recycling factor n=1 Tax=Helicobacter fennelliae MRY12-0050 TaxID=1325130 RepID=T1CZ08_9HELI|nr:ribosome recycling factor [Helicobacter fennelliae]GAD19180.1 ribosome recycling factor [Helicobacter fennelliae MRY12-0050]STP08254.1 ribosome recycling factor [Helicobacter fennelliae]